MSTRTRQLWSILLGAGERADAATTAAGVPVPQFAGPIRRSLVLTGHERTLAVVARQSRTRWEPALRHLPPENVLVEPQDVGTAPRVLLSVLHMLRTEPGATLVFSWAGQNLEPSPALEEAILQAADATWQSDNRVALLGVAPTSDDTRHGFIRPVAEPCGGPGKRVSSFVQAPPPLSVPALRAQGALWNTGMMVSRVSALVRLYERAHPALLGAHLKVLAHCDEWDTPTLERLYRNLPVSELTTDVLMRAPELLRVVELPSSTWTAARPTTEAAPPAQRVERMAATPPAAMMGVSSAITSLKLENQWVVT